MNFREIATGELAQIDLEIEVRKCPDQYVGRISNIEDAGNLHERKMPSARPNGEPCLLLVLESPHVSEFDNDLGPAKGTTGKNIVKYLRQVQGLSSFRKHGLVLVNAIQHQCSLGLSTERVRDRVFAKVWHAGGRVDFIARIRNHYRPGDTLVNCCTKGTSSAAASELRMLVQDAIQEALPGAPVIRRNHPSFWHFKANRLREWGLRPNPSIERDVQGLSPLDVPHVKR